jgi:hypothetical protein
MHERVSLSLSTGQVSLSPGDAAVTVDVTLANRSQVVDQFDLQLSGGQPDWYDVTPARVSLFPGESTVVKLALHPPRRENVLAGKYQIVVRATSRDDAGLASTAGIELTVVPSGGFELQLPKARDEGRSGSFRVHVTNLSNAPLNLALAASDPETALTFFFPAVQMELAPYEQRDLDFSLQPNRRRLKGEPRRFPFTVEATPRSPDRAYSTRDTQRAQGEFIYKPRLQRWPWEGLPAIVNIVLPTAAAVAALGAVLLTSGVFGGKDGTPTPAPDLAATLTAHDVAASATAAAAGAASSATAAAATVMATQSVTPTTTPTETPTSTPTPTPTAVSTNTPTATSTIAVTLVVPTRRIIISTFVVGTFAPIPGP